MRQVCTLSSLLLNFYIDKRYKISKKITHNKGIGFELGGILIPMIKYLDDILLTTEEEDYLKRVLTEIQIT